MEIMPGLHQITVGRTGPNPVNAYLALGAEPLLVDTGMPGQAEGIARYVESLGLEPTALRHIVLTHHDLDHIGSALELRQVTGARIHAHRLDAPCVAGQEPRRPWSKRITASLLGKVAFAVDELLEGEEEIAGWQVIHTPGHSMGSISLYRPPALIVGDLLLTGKDRCREMWRITMQDAQLARASIRKLAELEVDVLLCGHGQPLFGARPKLQALVSSWAA